MSSTSAAEATPDPAKVAIMFVKQYYKCLSSHPDMLERFYSPPAHHDSYLSHGEGSEPTAPSPFCGANHGHDRWGCADAEKMLFEFEDGAIDAQPSQNEGILMVVTASVIFTSKDGAERRKNFVQTFFLAKIGRNFAVTNDILRFLTMVAKDQPEVGVQTTAVEEETANGDDVAVVEATETKEAETTTTTTEALDETKTDVLEEKETPAAVTEDESSAPGGGVEESKEEAPEEEEAPKKRSSSKDKSKKSKAKQQPQAAPTAPVSKPAPGSWASLVVSGGSAPNTPSRAQEKKAPNNNAVKTSKQPPLPPSDEKENGETVDSQKKEKDKANNSTTNGKATKSDNNNNKSKDNNNNKSKDNKERTKRDPDNTLVIKNLSENIKEQDILNMFQPFATMTKAKIVGTNLNHHRLLAFVDYDSVAPVMAALKKHKETPFEWNGKVLEVDQKTLEQRARRKAGGNNQNNNNNNNNNQTNGYRNNQNNSAAGRGGNKNYNNNNNNGRGDGGRRRGTRAGR